MQDMIRDALRRIVNGPSPTEILARELSTAERQRIDATGHREFYTAMEEMLLRRIERLQSEIHNRTTT